MQLFILLTATGIDSILSFLCVKYVKYEIAVLLCLSHSDTDTVVGLPRPIHESIKTLKQVLNGHLLDFIKSVVTD